jgi:large subunit ribosomal protein L23
VVDTTTLVHPILTEKMVILKDEMNQYGFVVSKNSNKIQIKEAVEARYTVTVNSVRTVNMRGKLKRQGRYVGRKASWKKAIVTLKKGDKIELVEGL